MALRMRDEPGPDCLISGGEPTVTLADENIRGKGGRNQQLALAALTALGDCHDIALLSAGTDGEDGPTDAAGAIVTARDSWRPASSSLLSRQDYLDAQRRVQLLRESRRPIHHRTDAHQCVRFTSRRSVPYKQCRSLNPTTIDPARALKDRPPCGLLSLSRRRLPASWSVPPLRSDASARRRRLASSACCRATWR